MDGFKINKFMFSHVECNESIIMMIFSLHYNNYIQECKQV